MLFVIAVAVGVALRMACTSRGYNFDAEVLYRITALPFGSNFYKEVPYAANWGPLLYNLYQVFRALPGGNDILGFHEYVAVFCIACDVLSAFVLWQLWGVRAAVVFLAFSPVAIIMSGFHCNAEPAIVAIVLFGFFLHIRYRGHSVAQPHLAFLICIGCSLALKHAFVLFPLWLAMRPGPAQERIKCLLVPYGIWGVCVLPYVIPSPVPFVGNVLLYSGWSGNSLIPMAIEWLLRRTGTLNGGSEVLGHWWTLIFVLSLLIIGWLVRNWRLERLLTIYPLALLTATSTVALQYFTLAVFPLAVSCDGFSAAFNIFTAYFYSAHSDELHIFRAPNWLTDLITPGWHFNVGWLIAQAIVAVVLLKHVIQWRREDRLSPAADI